MGIRLTKAFLIDISVSMFRDSDPSACKQKQQKKIIFSITILCNSQNSQCSRFREIL